MLKKYFSDYLFYISGVKNLSYNTVKQYENVLNRFFIYSYFLKMDSLVDYDSSYVLSDSDYVFISDYVLSFSEFDVVDYLSFLSVSGVSASSRNCYLVTFRVFYDYLHRRGFVSSNPVANILPAKTPSLMPSVLSNVECACFLNSFVGTRFELRNRAMFLLFLYTGLRISELSNLNISDLDFSTRKLYIYGKGGKSRYVYISNYAFDSLVLYINSRSNVSPDSSMFLNHRGTRLMIRGIGLVFNKHLEASGLNSSYTVHSLRHTFATTHYEAGTPLYTISKMLGHSDSRTTEIYTRVSNDLVSDAFMKDVYNFV